MEVTEVIRHGIITEKSVALQNTPRRGHDDSVPRYTFKVHADANKYQIRQAVEELFGVKVVKVNTISMPGKARTIRTRKGFFHKDAQPWKKAIVTLAAGESIPDVQP